MSATNFFTSRLPVKASHSLTRRDLTTFLRCINLSEFCPPLPPRPCRAPDERKERRKAFFFFAWPMRRAPPAVVADARQPRQRAAAKKIGRGREWGGSDRGGRPSDAQLAKDERNARVVAFASSGGLVEELGFKDGASRERRSPPRRVVCIADSAPPASWRCHDAFLVSRSF